MSIPPLPEPGQAPKPAASDPVDVAPVDAAPGDAAPVDVAPGDAAPSDPAPSDPAPGDTAPDGSAPDDPPRRHAFALYNLARLGMLVVAFGVFYLLGLRGLGLVAAAFLVSGAVSYLVLYRVRVAASQNIGSAFRRLGERIDTGSRAEDD